MRLCSPAPADSDCRAENAQLPPPPAPPLATVEGKLVVAGLSNEEFASTLRVIAYPFKDKADPTAVEIYHGAHGRYETNAPVRTFVPYKIGGADYLMAAYTCTPLVKVSCSVARYFHCP